MTNFDDEILKLKQNSVLHIFSLSEEQLLGRTSMDPRWKSIREKSMQSLLNLFQNAKLFEPSAILTKSYKVT